VVSINFSRNPGQDGAYATGWLNSIFVIKTNYLYRQSGEVPALPNSHHPHKSQLRDELACPKTRAKRR
jgi:hypothetical protein